MALTAAQWKARVLAETGANLPDLDEEYIQSLTDNIDYVWDQFDDIRPNMNSYLRYLYAKRAAVDHVIGQLRDNTTATQDSLNPMLGQKMTHLLQYRDKISRDIDSWEKRVNRGRKGTVIPFTKTEPIEAPDGQNDASSRKYRGDPYLR